MPVTSKERYLKGKEDARQEAIEWQNAFADHSYTWQELAEFSDHFTKTGKRYGLLTEFKENGVI